MPPFRDYLDLTYRTPGNLWQGKFPDTLILIFRTFFHERKRRTAALRAVAGTPHAATFTTACGTALRDAKAAHDLATTVPMAELAITNMVIALDTALAAAEGQGQLALLIPPVPLSSPATRIGVFNPNTAADFVRFGIWVVRTANNALVATEVGSQEETVVWSNDSGISKKNFTTATRGLVATALETLRGRATTTIEIEPSVNENRHAEDTWFSNHLGTLLGLLADTDTMVRLEILVTVTMCERCRNHYLKYIRQLFGDIPIFIYTFRDDVMPQKAGPTRSQLERAQSVWEVIENADIKYRGTWTNLGTTSDTFNYRY